MITKFKTSWLFLAFIGFATSTLAVEWTAGRSHLSKLPSKGRMDWDDYQDDFLISESADILPVSKDEAVRRLRAQHEKTKLTVRGTFGKRGIEAGALNFENFPPPEKFHSPSQLKSLEACKVDKCAFKLNEASELQPLVQGKAKSPIYDLFVLNRLKRYLLGKELKGYEKRDDNVPYVKKAIQLQAGLQWLYPKSTAYLMGDFWKGAKSVAAPFDSYLRAEWIDLSSNQTQPVYRLAENLEFEEGGRYLGFEVHIYTNHYFDSSIRTFEIFPYPADPKQTVYIVTDLVEIDELKKSALIRSLFKARMEEAVSKIRKAEMKQVRR